MIDLEQTLTIAENTARIAGEEVIAVERVFSKEHKDRRDMGEAMGKEGDRRANDIITQLLGESFPDMGQYSEIESGNRIGLTKELAWVIDPIDGTHNFVEGSPGFAVSIALLEQGRPLLGVVYQPRTKLLFSGIVGRWAKCGGVVIHVSDRAAVKEARLTTSPTIQRQSKYPSLIARLPFHEIIYIGSAALRLAKISAGDADAYFTMGHGIESVAAGEAILLAAGGRCTDFSGNQVDYMRKSGYVLPLLASNGKIHNEMLHRIQGA